MPKAKLESAMTLIISAFANLSRQKKQLFLQLLADANMNERDQSRTAGLLMILIKDSGESLPQKLLLYQHKVGRAIRARRRELDLTQVEVEEISGIAQSHLCRIERGHHVPSYKTLELLASALKTTRAELDPGLLSLAQ